MGIGANVWNAYMRAAVNRPLATKAATCAFGFAMGDLIAQGTALQGSLPRRLKAMDLARTARMSAYGFVVAAPQLHVFFGFVDKYIMPHNPKSPIAVVSKVALDQLFNSPLGTCLFLAWNNSFQGRIEQTLPDIQSKLWETTKTGWMLWPAAQLVNMYFVPHHLRVAYINAVGIIWTCILSKMASKTGGDADVPQKKKKSDDDNILAHA